MVGGINDSMFYRVEFWVIYMVLWYGRVVCRVYHHGGIPW